MEPAARKVVLGLGNLLNRDEGLGVHCVEGAGHPSIPFIYY